jgi:hypothetical protein
MRKVRQTVPVDGKGYFDRDALGIRRSKLLPRSMNCEMQAGSWSQFEAVGAPSLLSAIYWIPRTVGGCKRTDLVDSGRIYFGFSVWVLYVAMDEFVNRESATASRNQLQSRKWEC